MKNLNLSPYKIFWATLEPVKGIVTKHDAIIINTLAKFHRAQKDKNISIYAPTKKDILKKINDFKLKLGKKYKVYIYTDKQFSMRNYQNDFKDILTLKQKQNVFII